MYQAYINASDLEKTAMERRYGKKQLETLVDDIQTASWMGKNSKQCPHCKAHIEKEDGCNKMACLRCGTYFCWLCQSVLDKKFPYLHFNRPTARCRLFDVSSKKRTTMNGSIWFLTIVMKILYNSFKRIKSYR